MNSINKIIVVLFIPLLLAIYDYTLTYNNFSKWLTFGNLLIMIKDGFLYSWNYIGTMFGKISAFLYIFEDHFIGILTQFLSYFENIWIILFSWKEFFKGYFDVALEYSNILIVILGSIIVIGILVGIIWKTRVWKNRHLQSFISFITSFITKTTSFHVLISGIVCFIVMSLFSKKIEE